ncbi:MAG: cysteine desulfurase [Spirochaetes bacterium]|nr:cysteine desulfurase [Spirochaetota bacterium]
MRNVYLDWAATSIPDSKILEKVHEISIETFANASSVHNAGLKAKKLLEDSREICAAALGVKSKNIFFTSGGTESNNISIYSVIKKKAKGTVLSTNIEHPSVYEPLKQLEQMGFNIVKIDSEKNGIINPDKIEERLTENTLLVSIIHINNETGAIQPVTEIAKTIDTYAKKINRKIIFHCDGVQAAGKIPFDIESSNIDFYTISSHKISGPKGVGLLYCKEKIEPLYCGGGQESGIRPGTENVAAIYGFSLALQQAIENVEQNLVAAKKKCSLLMENLRGIKECCIIPESRISADVASNTFDSFSPYILNFYIRKMPEGKVQLKSENLRSQSSVRLEIPAEVLVRVMSERGFFISAGSACSSQKKQESQTLKSMKIEKNVAASSVRVSIGPQTTEQELLDFCNALEEESKKLGELL